MKKIVIIDGKSVFYRGYYAMATLSTTEGTSTGGVYGFVSLAFEVIRKLKPDFVVVAWDKKGTSVARRLAISPDYKAGRKTPPEDFFQQIPLLHEFLEALGWPLFECDGYEADDILGTLSKQANEQGVESYLITSDLDMLQLISEHTKVFAMKRGFSQIEEFDLAYFEEKYGLKQSQFLDLKSLQGDSSDNISGVPGIGPKTATALLQEFETLDGIYENLEKIKPAWRKKLEDGKEKAYISKQLAEIWTDAPVEIDFEKADIKNFNYNKLLAILKKLEFNSLILKIPSEMKKPAKIHEAQIGFFDIAEEPKNAKIETLPLGDFWQIWQKDSLKFFEISENLKEIFIGNFENFAKIDTSEFVKKAEKTARNLVFFDAKQTFHQLEKLGFLSDFENFYDIKQMAFLLNSLIRDKSLSGLYGEKIDETSPEARISALRKIYESQQKELEKMPKLRKVAEEMDFPLAKILWKMENAGVKIDRDFFFRESKIFAKKIAEIESEIFDLAGQKFNVASPQQLSKVLFEDLALPTKGIKKSQTGFSTGQKELEKLRELHPIAAKIEEFREYSKLKNTYIDALPKLADSSGRIHTTFSQDVTTTGRLSSSNPNLQNIPIRSELGRKLRAGFVADSGKILIAADYSQFELRLAAVLAGDSKMIADFNTEIDIHQKTASEMFDVPLAEISAEQRRAAKVINFGVLYGMSAHRLSGELGTSFDEAKNFIENYFEVRKPIQKYIENTISLAENLGFVKTHFGRCRPTPDVKSSNFRVREAAKRAAANMPIQGTEADLMKKAMIEIDEKITKAGLGEQILQIHDSILIEAPTENAEKIAEILKKSMENICPELEISLKVDVKIGENWEKI